MEQLSHFTLLSFLSGGFSFLVAVLIVGMGQRYTQRVRLAFATLSATCAVWSTTYGLQLLTDDPIAATHWATIGWLSAIAAPTLWFVFVLVYTNADEQLTRATTLALVVEPVISVILTVTAHPSFLVPTEVVQTNGVTVVVPDPGFGFTIHLVYTFGLCIASLGLLLQQLRRSYGLYKRQATLLFVSGLFPLVALAVGLLELVPEPHADVTPMTLSVAMATALFALQRYRLFDITPVAREATFETLRDGIFVLDDQYRLVEANASARDVAGPTTPLGSPVTAVFSDATAIVEMLDDESGGEVTLDVDGATKTYEVTYASTELGAGKTSGHVLVFRDVTDFRRVEAQFRAVVENSRDMISVVDRDGVRQYASPSSVNVLGYEPSELVGKRAISFVHPDDQAGIKRAFRTARETGEPVREEFRARRADGAWRTFEVVAVTLSEGPLAGNFVVNSRDITERQLYEQRLNVFNRVLRHDLRNEVNVIHGYAGLLESESLSSTGRAYLDSIQRKASTLAALGEKTRQIDYTLDEERRTRHPIDVASLSCECAEEARETHPDAAISCTSPPEAWASGDDLLELALSNLVDNAIEHNDSDRPTVDIEVRTSVGSADGGSTGEWVEFSVTDDGPGIPPAERRVLEAGTETPLEHVSGLGLWVVAWVVDNLDGELAFEDRETRGSIVTIRLGGLSNPNDSKSESDPESESEPESERQSQYSSSSSP